MFVHPDLALASQRLKLKMHLIWADLSRVKAHAKSFILIAISNLPILRFVLKLVFGFFLGSILGFSEVSLASGAKRKVCAITINSADEKEVFNKYLSQQGFETVELLNLGNQSNSTDPEEWINKACESGIQCDVLIISGHFGGTFFGTSGKELSTETMEKHSCSNKCDGIFKNPKEVFLMGCNTLADKEGDHRTPAQYRAALMEHGISAADADRIVEVRYGALGSSYKDRMQRIFSGVPNIYGFDSVAPVGPSVRPRLETYLKGIKNYNEHIDTIEAQSILAMVDRANRSVRDINNTVLDSALHGLALAQCSGIQENDPAADVKRKICQLYDDDLNIEQKMEVIEAMLNDKDNLLYMPTANEFLNKFRSQIYRNPNAMAILERIKGNRQILNQMNGLIAGLSHSPTLQVDLLSAQLTIGWITESDFKRKAKEFWGPSLKNLNQETIDMVCSSYRDGNPIIDVTLNDFGPGRLRSPEGSKVFGCINTQDTRVTDEVLRGLGSQYSIPDSYRTLRGLRDLPPTSSSGPTIAAFARRFENSSDMDVKKMAVTVLLKNAAELDLESIVIRNLNRVSPFTISQGLKSRSFNSDTVAREASLALIDPKNRENSLPITNIIASATQNGFSNWSPLLPILSRATPTSKRDLLESLNLNGIRSPSLSNWAIENLRDPSHRSDYRLTSATLRMANNETLNRSQAEVLLTALREDPNGRNASVLRGLLRSQRQISYNSEELQLMAGVALVYRCDYSKKPVSCKPESLP